MRSSTLYNFYYLWLHRRVDQQKNMNARGEMGLTALYINISSICFQLIQF